MCLIGVSVSKLHTSLYNRRISLVSYFVPHVVVIECDICVLHETQRSHDLLAAAS